MSTNVADRPLSLAAHLETTASGLESHCLSYAWSDPASCNCGLLARTCGLSRGEILSEVGAPWTGIMEPHISYCEITGQPLNHVAKVLADAGMKKGDFQRLEYLDDDSIRSAAGITPLTTDPVYNRNTYRIGENAAKFMRTWASMIREYRAEHDRPCDTPAAKLFQEAS